MAIKILSLGSLPVKLVTKPHRKISDPEIKSVFFGQKIVCVGTGPSLDKVNIKTIKNSIVLLLNGAIEMTHQFDKSNTLFWLSIDSDRIKTFKDNAPKHVKKILSSHNISGLPQLNKVLQPDDYLIPFRYDLYISKKWIKTLPQRPNQTNSLIPLHAKNNVVQKGTVMLLALRLAATLQAKQIILLGYDATTSKKKSFASKISTTSDAPFSKEDLTEPVQKIIKECSRLGIQVLNASPLTEDTVIPQIKLEDIYAN